MIHLNPLLAIEREKLSETRVQIAPPSLLVP